MECTHQARLPKVVEFGENFGGDHQQQDACRGGGVYEYARVVCLIDDGHDLLDHGGVHDDNDDDCASGHDRGVDE